ncbi:MAG: hypothetical protein AB1750_07310 [Chloroflexota bacterium]
MQNFEFLIPLTWWQQAIFLAICVWVVAAARPEVALAMYLSIASWTRGFLIGPFAHIWVLLGVMILASLHLILTGRVKPFVLPPHRRGVLAWLGVWWAWMVLLFLVFRGDFESGQWETLYKNTILYTLAPLPVIFALPKEEGRVVSFAWAYILASAAGGVFAIQMLNVPFSYLLSDPTAITRKSFALGIYNYHWFAYQFAYSLVFIFAMFLYVKNAVLRALLGALALLCVYFLLLSSSRQSIFGALIALGFCLLWTLVSGRGAHRLWVGALALALLVAGAWIVQQAPDVLRLGLTDGAGRLDAALIREILQKRSEVSWDQGVALVPESPVWGLGFSRHYVSHNLFLGTLVDQGAVGLVFLLGFLFFWLGEAIRAWKTPAPAGLAVWKMAMVAVMVFALAQSQFSGSPLSEWALWWSAAFLWCLNGMNAAPQREPVTVPRRPAMQGATRGSFVSSQEPR